MSRALLLAALLSWAACGYTVGTGLAARGIRTVAFQVVGNESYRQRLEVEINRFLSRELPVTTDLQLARRSEADAVLQVVLTSAAERTAVIGTRDPSDPGNKNFPRVREGELRGAPR